MTKNWIGEPNPHGLIPPPAWFLKQLEKFDPDLVILAGISEPMFRLARRSPRAHHFKAVFRDGEAARMINCGCVAVRSMVPTFVWNQDLFTWLKARDTWEFGGPTKDASIERAIASVEAREASESAALQRHTDSELEAIGSSAYHSLLVRRGNLAFVRGYECSST